MPQALSLFAAVPEVLIADAECGVQYVPAIVDPMRAHRWFEALRDSLAWTSERRPMYDRIVDVPRLTAGFALADPGLPPVLREACDCIRSYVDAPFTHVGLNFYRDGRDSVAPHNDKLHSLATGHPIALLSLGATRRMDIRDKQPPRTTRRVPLEPGSLLLMSHASQHHYEHGIPKTREAVGPRISVVFRV
ncbi:MAG: alpha-ketoglutarate-dependent dioxygenase AlkB, partial [Luteimonas sp.]|nr:alpha-ketoglutarate-dependent dioxygenase AlkB [Luteimonas sp.]